MKYIKSNNLNKNIVKKRGRPKKNLTKTHLNKKRIPKVIKYLIFINTSPLS